jgi:DNA-binding CsgD family transcriptional regulator
VQEFEALTSGLSPEEVERAKRVELGIAARAGQARIVDINGVPTFVDPSTGTRSSLNAQQVEQARNAGVPVPPAALEPRQEALSTQEAELQAARRFEEVESLGKATGKAAVERLGALLPEADSGVESINVIDTLAETVEQGIRTGSIAEARQEAARALATFTGRDPSEAVANTDVFLATVGQQVAQNIRAFGAGTGLSDADREFARQMAGGNINASPEAILRILDINRKAAVRRVEKYNNARDAFVKRNPDFEEVFESLEVPSRGQVNQAPADFVFNPETGRLEPQ